LSESTKRWHEDLVTLVGSENGKGNWYRRTSVNDDFLEACFTHLSDLGKTSNKRIYIGPGRDGTSDDKIPIDCKFDPQNTSVPYNKRWNEEGYLKTTYSYHDGSGWHLIEN